MGESAKLQSHQAQNNRRTMLIKGACIAMLMAVLGGCASVSTRSPEEIVAERATERWAGLIKGDFAKAYQYNTPGYKGMVSQQRFQESRGRDGRVSDASAYKVTCETKDKCIARMKLTAFAPMISGSGKGAMEVMTYVDETWLLEEGQWWHFERI
ncbi:hypothetical protein G7048_07570 [Diaphorobacter sp. HDW4B]|uniref:hypothetical protein n=1 Tax=Diaphorobacter sp. HDW4B TaxID=2714925 RepID=UPI00140ABE46|nr:hypothetical protein [Diaphorobacter sp. HDW4B]QIL70224.1 hypothetical protein G7048_07570 [Diaphorobacter sp. HDW4B]